MAFRHHVIAALGVGAAPFERELGVPGETVGSWRCATTSVWELESGALDRRLGRISREAAAPVLRATTIDDDHVVVCLQRDGRRVALFDHPFGGLRRRDLLDRLDPEGESAEPPSLDEPVPAELLADVEDLDDEILTRLHAGQTLRAAWEAVTRRRAEDLTAALAGAGVVGVAVEPILGALRGTGRSPGNDGDPEEPVLDDLWGDLPRLLEALGIAGVVGFLGRQGPAPELVEAGAPGVGEEGEEGADDDGEVRGARPDREDEAPAPRAWRRSWKLGCSALGVVLTGSAVVGGWLGSRYGSPLATVGGAALGLLAPLLVGALVLLLPLGSALLKLFWRVRTLGKGLGARDLATRSGWIGRVRPEDAGAVRRALADWTDLAAELDGLPPRPGLFGQLYGDAFLPTGRGAKDLLARLERPGGVAQLGPVLAQLRVEVFDRQLAGGPLDDLRDRFLRLP